MKVYSIVYSHTRFIKFQLELWRKFCSFLSEFVVVNNGPDHAQISEVADRLGLRCLVCPPIAHADPSRSHASALNYALRTEAADSDSDAFFSDFDLFPIRPIEIIQTDLGFVPQFRGSVVYPWPGAFFVRAGISGLGDCDFNPGLAVNELCDTGAGFWQLLPSLRTEWFSTSDVVPQDLGETTRTKYRAEFAWQLIRGTWLHYLRGTNWFNYDETFCQRKEECLQSLVAELLGDM